MNSTGKCEQGRGMSEKGHLFISRGQPLVHIADGRGRRPKDERKGHVLLDYNSKGAYKLLDTLIPQTLITKYIEY